MIDLFATWYNNKLPLFVPDPKALQVDSMSMDWTGKYMYAFPPLAGIPKVVSKLLLSPGYRLMLVAPYWPTKTWFQDLGQRSIQPPFRVANPQRESTRKVYSRIWGVFQSWCRQNKVVCTDPSSKDLGRFILFLFKENGLLPVTIQGYRSARSNHLYGKVQWDIAQDPFLNRLSWSLFFRDKPVIDRRIPPWDHWVVLQPLSKAPFEPLALAPLKFVTLKTVF
jgi:hypothetical protein